MLPTLYCYLPAGISLVLIPSFGYPWPPLNAVDWYAGTLAVSPVVFPYLSFTIQMWSSPDRMLSGVCICIVVYKCPQLNLTRCLSSWTSYQPNAKSVVLLTTSTRHPSPPGQFDGLPFVRFCLNSITCIMERSLLKPPLLGSSLSNGCATINLVSDDTSSFSSSLLRLFSFLPFCLSKRFLVLSLFLIWPGQFNPRSDYVLNWVI